jgi:hypothetical protein
MAGDLSVKGVYRVHRGNTGDITLSQPGSVREQLEDIARTERVLKRKERPAAGWKAHYERTWTHIKVRIKLKPKGQDAEDALDNGLRATWKSGIEDAWNSSYGSRFSAGRGGELPCRLTFEAVFTDNDPHYTVHVKSTDTYVRSDMTHWDTLDDGGTAAHEFGHMIGKYDEYHDVDFPDREQVETGTIMDDDSSTFSFRQFTRYVDDLGCFLCFENGSKVPQPY